MPIRCGKDRWPIHFSECRRAEGVLQLAAIQARTEAKNHRDFKVGAAALVYDPSRNTYDIIEGACFKPHKGQNGPRVCAEEVPIVIARLKGLRIIGIFIAGDYQPDEDSGLPLKALVPCGRCRQKLMELREETKDLIHSHTRVMSFRLTEDGGVDTTRCLDMPLYRLMRLVPPRAVVPDQLELSLPLTDIEPDDHRRLAPGYG